MTLTEIAKAVGAAVCRMRDDEASARKMLGVPEYLRLLQVGDVLADAQEAYVVEHHDEDDVVPVCVALDPYQACLRGLEYLNGCEGNDSPVRITTTTDGTYLCREGSRHSILLIKVPLA